jgi:hypothetical protein
MTLEAAGKTLGGLNLGLVKTNTSVDFSVNRSAGLICKRLSTLLLISTKG